MNDRMDQKPVEITGKDAADRRLEKKPEVTAEAKTEVAPTPAN